VVEGPVPDVTPEELAAASDRLLADFGHRKLEIQHEAAGARLRPGLEAIGFYGHRLLWMDHAGLDALPAERGVEVAEVTPDVTRPLALAWVEPPHTPEEIAAHQVTVEEVNRRVGARYLAVLEDGEAIAYTIASRVGEDDWMVDALYVRPDRRGSGLGGALTVAAVRHAWEGGANAVGIVADDEGRPKELYARLGFRPAWVEHDFVITPAARGAERR
jgi:GNAT superfamily N-acetyltransferase